MGRLEKGHCKPACPPCVPTTHPPTDLDSVLPHKSITQSFSWQNTVDCSVSADQDTGSHSHTCTSIDCITYLVNCCDKGKEEKKRKEKSNGKDLKGEKLILAHSSEGSAHHTGEDSASPIDGRRKLRLSHMSVDQGAEPSSQPQVPSPQPYVCQTSTIFKQSYQRGTRCSNYNMVYKYL